ncbi:MAG: TatD family hydrolase, partial [Muribaculum intestinale]|nr:TatD family hydrolase [Muribaculum intestinale]
LRDVLTDIGIDRILLETDSPYLAPVPHRGHRNESAYVALVARTVADSLGIDYYEVCRRTTVNAMTLFGIME